MDRYFYIVEMDGGSKVVHISGNIYYNNGDESEKCFRLAEWTGLYLSLDELREFIVNDDLYEYLNERVMYLADLTEDEAVDMCQVYFNGESGKWLNIKHVNENTPCGDYWFE